MSRKKLPVTTVRQGKLRAYWRMVKDLQFAESERRGKLISVATARKLMKRKNVLNILRAYDPRKTQTLKYMRQLRKTLILLGYKAPSDETLPGETP